MPLDNAKRINNSPTYRGWLKAELDRFDQQSEESVWYHEKKGIREENMLLFLQGRVCV